MIVLVSTNIREGKGLARDYELLKVRLEARGHQVIPAQFDASTPNVKADLGIVLERCKLDFFEHCDRAWLIPNPEWWSTTWTSAIPLFEKILCKTEHALDVFQRITPKAEFLGWESADRMVSKLPRTKTFFFNPGGSTARGHEAVYWTWERLGANAPELVVIGKHCPPPPRLGRVRWSPRVDDEELQLEQNKATFHLHPSSYEGWGHSLHESLSVGAVVASTAAPPMTDAPAALRMRTSGNTKTQGLVDLQAVDREHLEWCVETMIQMRPADVQKHSEAARAFFLAEKAAFAERFDKLMETACR